MSSRAHTDWGLPAIVTAEEERELVRTVCQLVLPRLHRALSNLSDYAFLVDGPEPGFVSAADFIEQAIEVMSSAEQRHSAKARSRGHGR
ncbi:hypothetical protein Xlen_03910 [Xanthomonas campestris pv. leeana]|nr:hypothetical protein Xths_06005 [Xanthomonas campestris pv. thespesiae]OOW76870.1 hypothetical protein Xlen_03910 [Xanthomonas campestris pv. leeana]